MSEPQPPAKSAPKLAELVKTLQFAWFVGHVTTLVATTFFALSYVRVFPSAYKFWYKLALVGVVDSFGVLVFQAAKKGGVKPAALLGDDNVHYLFLGAGLLLASPYVLLTLSVYVLFSTFHVLSYTKHYLLPAAAVGDSHPLSVKIGQFVLANNAASIRWAAVLEVVTLAWLLVRLVTFRAVLLVPFVLYAVFVKLRFEKSAFTRAAFKSVEMRAEQAVNATANPKAKEVWIQAKAVFHRVAGVHLVHDHTKEKAA